MGRLSTVLSLPWKLLAAREDLSQRQIPVSPLKIKKIIIISPEGKFSNLTTFRSRSYGALNILEQGNSRLSLNKYNLGT